MPGSGQRCSLGDRTAGARAQVASTTAAEAGGRTGMVASGIHSGARTRACGSGGFAVDDLHTRGRGGIVGEIPNPPSHG
jgi:hypothetical protein